MRTDAQFHVLDLDWETDDGRIVPAISLYVYLMRYKFEAFARFKEFRLEVKNQTDRKIKTLRSDRGGEYLSGEFLDYLKENRILSQWTPPGMPQLNGVSERRNRTLLDMVRPMMSFTELPLSFWGYALKTAAKLLNMAPSKTVAQTPYQIWHGKPVSYKYLRVWGSPAYIKRLVGDKLDSRSSLCSVLEKRFSSGYPTSTRVSQQPERYGFMGLTGQLDNDPKIYGEAMSDINSKKWIEAIKSEMDSLGADGEVTTFKARLVAKGYTKKPVVDSEKTYSPVAVAKSIRIILAIAAWYDYEIWQMDVKMAFLNGWNIHFDEVIRGYDFIKNDYDPCIYKKVSGSSVAFLMLYVDNILLIGNDVKMLGDTKAWLSTQFSMKDLVKTILKYLRRTKDMFLVYGGGELILEGYSDASFQSDEDDAKSQLGLVFKLNGGVVACKSSKQDTTADSTTEAEYIAASKAAKEAVWMKNYIQELGVVPSIVEPMVIFCDNNGAIAQAKEPRSHHTSKHILRHYHLLRKMVGRGDVRMDRVTSAENMANLLTKPVSQIAHAQHLGKMV
ncbi:UNVERIFIED_CONTAM: Retrovirus-related Pol polyprotein from transposon TNT 1-94 [Sesamum latifolium]|uniref:Retrovirus-related Pol polyprotein from transposon TNT 1-94 n=1 Tax=Sesamum latifolium TaxID=2727402 RepID=A0AAW2UU43_9LAMI